MHDFGLRREAWHAVTGRTCKFHTEKLRVGTRLCSRAAERTAPADGRGPTCRLWRWRDFWKVGWCFLSSPWSKSEVRRRKSKWRRQSFLLWRLEEKPRAPSAGTSKHSPDFTLEKAKIFTHLLPRQVRFWQLKTEINEGQLAEFIAVFQY